MTMASQPEDSSAPGSAAVRPSSSGSANAPARPTSPVGSLYAFSDDEEGEYNTITHTETGRGVKLLFSKSKVYVHPTASSKDNIPGYIALLQQKGPRDAIPSASVMPSSKPTPRSSDLLLAWVPEDALGDSASIYVKVDMCEGDSPPKQTYLVPPPPTITSHSAYTAGSYAFAIPVSAIYSLFVRPPNFGWWFGSLIINTRSGDSFPALFFHDSECQSTLLQRKKLVRETFDPFGPNGTMFWGGDEVLRWLRRYVKIQRTAAEPNIYLVEPSLADSEAFGSKLTTDSSAARLGRKDIMRGADGNVSMAGGSHPVAGPSSHRPDAAMDPFTKFVKETGWNIMEKFSRVSTFTRRAAQDLVVDNPNVPLPPQVRRLLRNPQVQTIGDEFDSARIYLARWAMGMAEQSERDRNKRIWTARDVLELEDTDVGEFELLEGASSLSIEEQRKPVTLKEWNSWFDQRTGRLGATTDEVKERIFHGGLDPDDGVRKEAWLFLLGVYEWYSTADERRTVIASLRDEYVKLKGSWWERLIDMGGQGPDGDWWREQRNRIEKDVHRTDRTIPIFAGEDTPHPDPDSPFAEVGTNVHLEQMKDMLLTYNEFNTGLGYVQGMSDLLAPVYAVMQDDAMAFWGFQRFMDRMERNFLRDQSGMREQLLTLAHLVQFMDPKLYAHLERADSTNFFFFFRMLLVWFKREFSWKDTLRLWEALWTDYLSSNFHIFVALAILEKHRDIIMAHLKHFDEVLKYINELSNTMDLDSTLVRAEALFRKFQRLVNQIDKKQNFPAPTVLPVGPSTSTSSVVTTGTNSDTSTVRAAGPGSVISLATDESGPSAAGKPVRRDISPELRNLLSKKIIVLTPEARKRLNDGASR